MGAGTASGQPGYPGQSAGYPGQPAGYPGQPAGYPPYPAAQGNFPPQAAYPPQVDYQPKPGFIPSDNNQTTVPPKDLHISKDDVSADDADYAKNFEFNTTSIRRGFIRKVYGLLTVNNIIQLHK